MFKKSTVDDESREIVRKGHQCLWLFCFFLKSKMNDILNHSLIFLKSLIFIYMIIFLPLSHNE